MRRTRQQNESLHLYLRHLAEALNDAGLDMKKTLKEEIDIPWNEDRAKEFLWRPLQKAMTGKDSSTEPSTADYVEIYSVLNRHLATKLGVSVPWPSARG